MFQLQQVNNTNNIDNLVIVDIQFAPVDLFSVKRVKINYSVHLLKSLDEAYLDQSAVWFDIVKVFWMA